MGGTVLKAVRQSRIIFNYTIYTNHRPLFSQMVIRPSFKLKGPLKQINRNVRWICTSHFLSEVKKPDFKKKLLEGKSWIGIFSAMGFALCFLLPTNSNVISVKPSRDCKSTIQRTRDGKKSNNINIGPTVTSKDCVLATSSSIGEGQHSMWLDIEPEISDHVDFVVVGYGNTGRNAVEELKRICPKASIMVIDPNVTPVDYSGKQYFQKRKKKENIQYLMGSVIGLNHTKQTLLVFASKFNENNNMESILMSSPSMKTVHFKRSILIATGCRGAPVPQSLIDSKVMDRVLELRSTQLKTLSQLKSNSKSSSGNKEQIMLLDEEQTTVQGKIVKYCPCLPVLPTQGVRQIALMAASQGASVCLLGSGVEALELATACAMTTAKMNDSKEKKNNITLIFGSVAPLNTVLPMYLSKAVSKRLKHIGIEIEDRSLVRYVSASKENLDEAGEPKNVACARVEVHLERSFDEMDTHRRKTDLLIVAPCRDGQRGSAVVPTLSASNSTLFPTLEFQPWSKLTSIDESALACYADDGRIAVNSELSAAFNIYAAGSVAKYPNSSTGHASIMNRYLAGRLAANNMVKDYYNDSTFVNDIKNFTNDHSSRILSRHESIPVWRTDHGMGHHSFKGSEKSALAQVGIHALCVGQCDSTICGTHGFWWTNHNLNKKISIGRRFSAVTNENNSRKVQKRKTMSTTQRAVYGSGVVFYLDRSGAIRGIMLWGLPFTNDTTVGDDLNESLVRRIKNIILTNGDIMMTEHESLIESLKLDTSKLQVAHLSEESKLLASLAISSTSNNFRTKQRPLHRFLQSKPVNVTSMGRLKRNEEIGYGSSGEDIFALDKESNDTIERCGRQQSLLHYHAPSFEYKDSDFDARPPKEDLLWKRNSDSHKLLSINDTLSNLFTQNMRKGQFQDGSDAVQRAPTPKMFQDVREAFDDWTSNKNDSDSNY